VPLTAKTCPGTSIDKADILRRVMRLQLPQVTPVALAMRRPSVRGTVGSAAAAR